MSTHTQDEVPGIIQRILRKIDFAGKKVVKDAGPAADDDYRTYEEPVVADIDEANVLTSAVAPSRSGGTHGDVMHAPVLDFDFPCQLIPSTTPGHFHLVMDKEISWIHYERVLWAMAQAGLIEDGYYDASNQRGYTAIRLPWVKRDPRDPKHYPKAAKKLPELSFEDQLDIKLFGL